jgi:RND family efflux transporter MFP subunit
MKIIKPILIAAAAFALIISVLMFNKSRMDAQAESPKGETAVAIVAVKAEKKTLAQVFSAVGAIKSENDVVVISETSGKVIKVLANVGSLLRAGDAIVQVDSEIKSANFLAAEAQFEKAKKDVDRYQVLRRESGVAEIDVEQMRLALKQAEANYIIAKRQISDATIRAPISGALTERKFNIGEMIQPDAPVATIVNTSALKITVFISEKDILKLRVGESVEISVDVYPEKTFAGKIKSISDKADDAGAFAVEVSLLNTRQTPLKIGMTARLTFRSLSGQASIVLPRLAVQSDEKKSFVFAVENGIAVEKPVITGRSASGEIEIISGLNGGEIIVSGGQTLLKNGTPVVAQ